MVSIRANPTADGNRRRGRSIEQLRQKRLLALAVAIATVVVISALPITTILGFRFTPGRCCIIDTTFNDFIQFSSVEPNAATCRTKVDFDALSVGHCQARLANWTWHDGDRF